MSKDIIRAALVAYSELAEGLINETCQSFTDDAERAAEALRLFDEQSAPTGYAKEIDDLLAIEAAGTEAVIACAEIFTPSEALEDIKASLERITRARALLAGKAIVPVSLPMSACVAIERDIENMVQAAPLLQRLDGYRVWQTALEALAAPTDEATE